MLIKIQEYFPKPQLIPTNAVNVFDERFSNQGKPFLGSYTTMENQIKISARAVIELLSGEITQEDFFAIYEFVLNANSLRYESLATNPFKLLQGKSLSKVEVEIGENEADDDWLIFNFGNADAATSKFVLPENQKLKSK